MSAQIFHRGVRAGFTLVELLVVIVIIGILVSLLMPAIQAARESARCVHCRNNLKQLSAAWMQHEQVQGHLPTGGWGYLTLGDPDRGYREEQPGGWGYNILPYIEHENLHQMGAGKPMSSKKYDIRERSKVAVSQFLCPSRRRVATAQDNHKYLLGVGKITLANRNDYAANQGTTYAHTCLGKGPRNYSDWDDREVDEVIHGTSSADPISAWGSIPWDGVCYRRSKVRTDLIHDGASNTFMLGEKWVRADAYVSGKDVGDNENLTVGYDTDMNRSIHRAFWPPQRDCYGADLRHYFGSAHHSFVHFALCDGSVHRIAYGIDADTYWQLGSRNDGIPIRGDKW